MAISLQRVIRSASCLVLGRALRRAGRAAAAEFFHAPPPPKFSIGAPNAAAAEIFGQRRRKSAAWLKMRPSPKDSQ